jgi:hypothetical protein
VGTAHLVVERGNDGGEYTVFHVGVFPIDGHGGRLVILVVGLQVKVCTSCCPLCEAVLSCGCSDRFVKGRECAKKKAA